MEDIAQIGVGNFEASLRENLSMALADAYDHQAISGGGVAPHVSGLLHQLTRPATDPSDVADFDDFVETVTRISLMESGRRQHGDVVTWSSTLETYRLSASTFQTVATGGKGELAASSTT